MRVRQFGEMERWRDEKGNEHGETRYLEEAHWILGDPRESHRDALFKDIQFSTFIK